MYFNHKGEEKRCDIMHKAQEFMKRCNMKIQSGSLEPVTSNIDCTCYERHDDGLSRAS